MITKIKEPYKISTRDVDMEFNGRWVLLFYNDLEPAEGYGYIVAHGGEMDWDELDLLSSMEYGGKAQLVHGYKNRGTEMLHVL